MIMILILILFSYSVILALVCRKNLVHEEKTQTFSTCCKLSFPIRFYRGNWHGDVAIKMLNMDPERETQSQLQAFKMEVG